MIELDLNDIDKLNLQCYEIIANEYDDPNHETCKDFDAGTECFLKKAVKFNIIPKGFKYLDVGVGTGRSLEYILPWLQEMNAEVEVMDISPKMIEITKEKFGLKIHKYHVSSIHNFSSDVKYDLIVAALCDPYLTKESLQILKNLLAEDGILMMTLPTNTWARKVRRDNLEQTFFHDKDRKKISSYSFCWSKGDLIKYVESIGLTMQYGKVIFIDDIKRTKFTVSKINDALLQREKRVPLLLTLIFLNK